MQFRVPRSKFGINHGVCWVPAYGSVAPVNCQEGVRFRHFSAKRFNNDRCRRRKAPQGRSSCPWGALDMVAAVGDAYRRLTSPVWSWPSLLAVVYMVPVSVQITSVILTSAGMSSGSKWSALGAITTSAYSL